MSERDPLRMSSRERVEEINRLRHLLKRHLSRGGELWMESGVSHRTGEGFVHLHWGDSSGQLTPEETRQHAVRLLETAAACEFDAALYRVATEQMGLPPEGAAALLSEIRKARGHSDEASAEA